MPLSKIDASDSLQMASGYACQRCSQLPPPPMFSINPPPNLLSIEFRCSSPSPSSSLKPTSKTHSSTSLSIVLGFLIGLLIFSSTCLLIKKRLVKRRRQKTRCEESMMISSSSVKLHRRHQNDNHHQNWTKLIPLLSESCSSDQTSATPPHDYPCSSSSAAVIEPLLTRADLHHEYEQIKCDDSLSGSLHYYCLVYCRQCATYHPTSSSSTSSSSSLCPRTNLIRSCYMPLSSHHLTCQHQCTCYHQRADTRLFEHHPSMFMPRTTTTTTDHPTEDLPPLKFIEEMPSI